jgi:hypothetical protein
MGIVWVAALWVRGEEGIDVALMHREAQLKLSCHGIGLQVMLFPASKCVGRENNLSNKL